MSRLEDALRESLADPRRDLESWPDPAARIRNAHRRRVRGRALTVSMALLVAMVGGGIPFLLRDDSRPEAPTAANPGEPAAHVSGRFALHGVEVADLAGVDPSTGRVWVLGGDAGGPVLMSVRGSDGVIVTRTSLSLNATRAFLGYGSVWLLDEGGLAPKKWTLARVSTDMGQPTKVVVSRPGSANDLAFGDSAVWVTTANSVVRVDPDTDQVVADVSLARPGEDFSRDNRVVANESGVWVYHSMTTWNGRRPERATRLLRIDASSNVVGGERILAVVVHSAVTRYGWGSELVLSADTKDGSQLMRLDGVSLEEIQAVQVPRVQFGLRATEQRIWGISDTSRSSGTGLGERRLELFDRSSLASIGASVVGESAFAVAVEGNRIWLVEEPNVLVRLDAATPEPGSFEAQPPPVGPGVEIGRHYDFTLYTHCGIQFIRVDGRIFATPKLDDGSGNPPPGWGNPQQEGSITLTDRDTALFNDDLGHKLTFRPAPPDAVIPPCD